MTVAFAPEYDTAWAKLWDQPRASRADRQAETLRSYFNLGGEGVRAFQEIHLVNENPRVADSSHSLRLPVRRPLRRTQTYLLSVVLFMLHHPPLLQWRL